MRQFARALAEDAADLEGPVEAEVWASDVLGISWEGRFEVPPEHLEDPEPFLVQPLLAALGATASPGALIGLLAIAEVSESAAAQDARALAEELAGAGVEAPQWTVDLGRSEVVAAAVLRDEFFQDGQMVFLESKTPDGRLHSVGVDVDNNLGLQAVAITVGGSLEQVRELLATDMGAESDPAGRTFLDSIPPADASARIRAAIGLADLTSGMELGEEFAAFRSLALLRADQTPGVGSVAADVGVPRDVTEDEIERLIEEFSASPEGQAPAGDRSGGAEESDGNAEWVLSLAFDFCASYGDGDLLRWTPARVQMLMEGWIPHKVIADEGLHAALPAVLTALVRYAGRVRAIPDRSVAVTVEQIEASVPAMREAAKAADAISTGEMFAAARDAGVDLADVDQLRAFLDEWNQGRAA